ncbi:uncharacterized protein LOC143785931 [Ranitomeya variabilis]|uniref:uncharacterized protein LOC143785931 n=1 Tax=Ranitomeya variabilis TaxID=490064 RepID=UPI004057B95A
MSSIMPSQTMQRIIQISMILLSGFHSNLASPTSEKIGEISSLPNDICPTLICGSENMTIIFLISDLKKLKVDVDSIHLIDSSCEGFKDDRTVSIQSPTKVGMCGTYVIVNETHANYKNNIVLKPDPSLDVYRENYVVYFSCIYPLNMNVSLETVLKPIISTKTFTVTGSGEFEVKMAIFKDPAYVIPREEGDVLSTKDMLYVGVTITKGDTDHFDLVMKNCFATPTNNFYDNLKYYIIKDSCKNKQDNTIHVAANGIASYGQFSVQAFQFIKGSGKIFLHCQVHLCEKSGTCIPDCNRDSSSDDDPGNPDDYLSLGVGVKEPENLCPDLQCGASYINVTLPRSDLIDSHVDYLKLETNGGKCHDLYEDGNIVSVGWPLGVGICGTKLITNNTHAIYKNLIYLPPIASQIINRAAFYINVSCIYPLDLNVSLQKVLSPIISTVYFEIEGNGQFDVIMAAFKDQTYQEPYETGVITLSTKDRLFIGVFISKGDTSQFKLVMQHCYATPTQNPDDPTKYGIIVNSCANEEDQTILIYANGISSEGKFSILMFKFVKHSYVFLHCKVNLCSKSEECIPGCPRPNFRSAAPLGKTLTLGPFHLDNDVNPSDNPIDTTIVTVSEDKTDAKTSPLTTTVAVTADAKTSPLTTTVAVTADANSTSPIIIATTSSADKRTCLDLLTLFAILLVTLML